MDEWCTPSSNLDVNKQSIFRKPSNKCDSVFLSYQFRKQLITSTTRVTNTSKHMSCHILSIIYDCNLNNRDPICTQLVNWAWTIKALVSRVAITYSFKNAFHLRKNTLWIFNCNILYILTKLTFNTYSYVVCTIPINTA